MCLELVERNNKEAQYAYELNDSAAIKIEKVAKKIYHADSITYSDAALKVLKEVEEKYSTYPVCIAKTQYSFSDNSKLLGAPEGHVLHVDDILIRRGAKFIVAVCGGMMLMPGLPKVPAAVNMKYNNGDIEVLF